MENGKISLPKDNAIFLHVQLDRVPSSTGGREAVGSRAK